MQNGEDLLLIAKQFKEWINVCHLRSNLRAVVVAQLAARSLPIPEDPGSNPVIGNFYRTFRYLLLTVCRKDEK